MVVYINGAYYTTEKNLIAVYLDRDDLDCITEDLKDNQEKCYCRCDTDNYSEEEIDDVLSDLQDFNAFIKRKEHKNP